MAVGEGDRGNALGGREHVDKGVLLPGQPLLGVARASPEVDGQLATHAHRAGGTDLLAGGQVAAEGVGDRPISGIDVSL